MAHGMAFLWNFDFSSHYFASINFGDGFFQFQNSKVSLNQGPNHNYRNTIIISDRNDSSTYGRLDKTLFEFSSYENN